MRPLPFNIWVDLQLVQTLAAPYPGRTSACAPVQSLSSLSESSYSLFHYCCVLNIVGFLFVAFSSTDFHRVKPRNVAQGLHLFLSRFCQVGFFPTLMIASFRTCRWNQPWKINFYDSANLDSLAWILVIKCFLICLQLLPLRPGNSFHCMMQEFKCELYI